MTAIILLMLLSENSNSNGPLLDGFQIGQNRPAVVRPADRPFLNRLSRPFRRNR